MAKGYDSLNDTFNTDDSVEVDSIVKAEDVIKPTDVNKDYDYTRGNLYSLIEKGQEAINGIMEVAGETASPRAYEVAGQLIKSVADTTDKLLDLQQNVKEVNEDEGKTNNNVTNNALFVGSTSELSKLIKQGFLNNKEKSCLLYTSPSPRDGCRSRMPSSA